VNSNASPHSFDTRFGWRGVDTNGASKRGKTIAADSARARAALKRGGGTVLELTALGVAPPPKARAADVTLFTRQLAGLLRAGLLRAGLPLAPSLELIADTPWRGGLPRIVESVARDITQGVAFSEALARHPACFNALYCQLVAVGEVAGALPVVLARLAEDRERAGAQRAKLRAALTYPVVVLLLSLAITAGLLIGVVPTFKTIFDGFGAKLPAPTLFVLALSDGVARWYGPFALFCVVSGIAFKRLLGRVPAARSAFDRAMLKLPLAGSLLRALAVARWSRALGTLLAAGIRYRMRSTPWQAPRATVSSIPPPSRSPGAFGMASGSPPPCVRSDAFRRMWCSLSPWPRNPARSTRCCSTSLHWATVRWTNRPAHSRACASRL
jgi:type IV pilus assembly protein PilC